MTGSGPTGCRRSWNGRRCNRNATRVALAEGADPEALIWEAEALVARARASGARTWEEINAFAAEELGIDPSDLQAERARVAAMTAP